MDRSSLSDIDTFGWLRSLHAPVALDGGSWVQSGSVEIAIGQVDRMLQNRRRHPLPPWGNAPLGSRREGGLGEEAATAPWPGNCGAPLFSELCRDGGRGSGRRKGRPLGAAR